MNEPPAYIRRYNLKDWWFNSFTDDERKHIAEVFHPMGIPECDPDSDTMQSSGGERILNFLSSLAGWFDNPRDRCIAHKIILKAEEFVVSENNILDIHFFYPAKMKLFYKNRDDPAALQEAINACVKQIEIAEKAATSFRNEWGDYPLPVHEGYQQLCIILEKQKKIDEAIKLAEQARNQGWRGDWDRRIERYRKKSVRKSKK
jgi:hypothetical protein